MPQASFVEPPMATAPALTTCDELAVRVARPERAPPSATVVSPIPVQLTESHSNRMPFSETALSRAGRGRVGAVCCDELVRAVMTMDLYLIRGIRARLGRASSNREPDGFQNSIVRSAIPRIAVGVVLRFSPAVPWTTLGLFASLSLYFYASSVRKSSILRSRDHGRGGRFLPEREADIPDLFQAALSRWGPEHPKSSACGFFLSTFDYELRLGIEYDGWDSTWTRWRQRPLQRSCGLGYSSLVPKPGRPMLQLSQPSPVVDRGQGLWPTHSSPRQLRRGTRGQRRPAPALLF